MLRTHDKKRISKVGKLGLALLLVSLLLLPVVALAHPLGNFTVNQYTRLEIGANGIQLYYVLDRAEIPTFQEKDAIDLNRDGQLSDAEKSAYLETEVNSIKANLNLSLNGTRAELKLLENSITFNAGQGGLDTTRLVARFETSALPDNAASLTYQNNNFADRLGWREVIVRNASGIALMQSSAPTTDQSNELRTYPQDMLANPLNVTTAQVSFRLDPSVVVNNSDNTAAASTKTDDPFASLVNGGELTVGVVLVAFALAFLFGMLHALSPGHGKTIVAAYLVGTRGTVRHAAFLGLTVTVTHTIGVFALGFITLFASRYILPEQLYPWLGVASGLIVLLMGLTLLRSRLRYAFTGQKNRHSIHEHKHEEPAHVPELAYAVSGVDSKALPVTNLAGHSHDQHDHNHEHAHHEHDHHDHAHHEHDQHEHEGAHVHSHGGKAHSHLPPGTDGTEVTWKRLLFFGISAGLLPCPSALVVMLSAIALNRTAFGLVLVVFFSLGLAATLTLLGFLFVYGRKMLNKINISPAKKTLFVKIVPVVSAVLIAVLGIIISLDALVKTGIIKG